MSCPGDNKFEAPNVKNTENVEAGESFVGEAAYVYGWGTTEYGGSSPSELLEVEVRVVSQEECRSQGVTAAMLCAGGEEGKDSCQVSDI